MEIFHLRRKEDSSEVMYEIGNVTKLTFYFYFFDASSCFVYEWVKNLKDFDERSKNDRNFFSAAHKKTKHFVI